MADPDSLKPSRNQSESEQIAYGPGGRSLTYSRWAIISLLASFATLAWMFAGGLVTYAPGLLTANEMQHLYLLRIHWYGMASAALQFLAIWLFVRSYAN